ncbi:MAG: hypothetical protein C0467_22145 [Planctomycetaceae bacterium]|nr:hypothetical protein [Planctomycetaceae bacterium]
MSEEAAFLEAMKANPADDTARLVYADWLDEHAEPAKAEYLRLVTALAHAEQDYDREQPDVSRVLALSDQLPSEWRAEAGSRFKVIYEGFDDARAKIEIIIRIREVCGRGLAEAKAMCEQPPTTFFPCVPIEQGLLTRDFFRTIPGVVIRLQTSDDSKRSDISSYNIYACQRDHGREATRQFAAFIETALGLSPAAARKEARAQDVLIATELEPYLAFLRIAELKQLLPATDVGTHQGIRIGLSPVQSTVG